jgi:hypothetical protein
VEGIVTKQDDPKPAKAAPSVVVKVTGSHAVDGVEPGGTLPVTTDLHRLRYLLNAGHVTITVDGNKINDGHLVARIEGA